MCCVKREIPVNDIQKSFIAGSPELNTNGITARDTAIFKFHKVSCVSQRQLRRPSRLQTCATRPQPPLRERFNPMKVLKQGQLASHNLPRPGGVIFETVTPKVRRRNSPRTPGWTGRWRTSGSPNSSPSPLIVCAPFLIRVEPSGTVNRQTVFVRCTKSDIQRQTVCSTRPH